MDCKLELSKFHRYTENFEDYEKSLPKDYDESKDGSIISASATISESARLTTEQRNALSDSDFAVVVRVKDKRTGKMRKIRMFSIHNEAHVRNALARLGQPAPQATLRELGVSIETVKNKIMKRARQLNMKLVKKAKVKKEQPKKADIKKVEPTVEKIELEKKTDKIEAQKRDLELYALEDKIAKYITGIRKLAFKVRSTNKELKTVKAEKEEQIKFYKENAKKIHDRREELMYFAKDLSDEDITNDDKLKTARLEKQVAENKTIETASENVGDKTTNRDEYTKIREQIDENAFPKVKG